MERCVELFSHETGMFTACATMKSEEHERIREEVIDLKITVDGLETERDFYFQKLRDIEIMCQAWEENPDGSMTVNKFVEEVQNILYAKDDEIGGGSPDAEAS
eukprot:s683_g6.t1